MSWKRSTVREYVYTRAYTCLLFLFFGAEISYNENVAILIVTRVADARCSRTRRQAVAPDTLKCKSSVKHRHDTNIIVQAWPYGCTRLNELRCASPPSPFPTELTPRLFFDSGTRMTYFRRSTVSRLSAEREEEKDGEPTPSLFISSFSFDSLQNLSPSLLLLPLLPFFSFFFFFLSSFSFSRKYRTLTMKIVSANILLNRYLHGDPLQIVIPAISQRDYRKN